MQRLKDVILFQIEQASKASKQYSQREFDALKLDLTVEQWVLIMIVSENPNLTQRELADKSRRDPASITRTLDLLEKKGRIMRNVDPLNRRTYIISMTEAGKGFIKTNANLIAQHREQSVANFTEEDLAKFSGYLQRIIGNMK